MSFYRRGASVPREQLQCQAAASCGTSTPMDAARTLPPRTHVHLIIASSPHLCFISAARQVARGFDGKFWVEIRDLWPESIIALGMTPAWHPLVKLLGWKERSAYRAADRVVCLLTGAEPPIRARVLPAGKFTWIPNGLSYE